MNFEGFDKDILDVDFRNKTVLVNNVRIAEFSDATGQKIKGPIKRDAHTFNIDKPKLTKNAAQLGHEVDADKVQKGYGTAMGS